MSTRIPADPADSGKHYAEAKHLRSLLDQQDIQLRAATRKLNDIARMVGEFGTPNRGGGVQALIRDLRNVLNA